MRCPKSLHRSFLDHKACRDVDVRLHDALKNGPTAIHFYNCGQDGRQEYSELTNSAQLFS
jgi:hypothetical protein